MHLPEGGCIFFLSKILWEAGHKWVTLGCQDCEVSIKGLGKDRGGETPGNVRFSVGLLVRVLQGTQVMLREEQINVYSHFSRYDYKVE